MVVLKLSRSNTAVALVFLPAVNPAPRLAGVQKCQELLCHFSCADEFVFIAWSDVDGFP